MSNFKKISEVEIKTVIQLHSKADSLDYESLTKILISEPITKEIANIVLKKILMNATVLTKQAIITLQLLISLGASFDLLEDGDGCTALMNACLKGSYELARFIIQENPDQLGKTSKQGRNCLFYAISSNNAQSNLDLIQTLLNAGVNPNHRENLHGDSCLSLAVKNGYSQISALLLEHGAEPNIILEPNKQTLIHIACNNLNLDLMNILILKGANPIVKNAKGEYPINILMSKLNETLKNPEEYNTSIAMMKILSNIMASNQSLFQEESTKNKQTRKASDDSSNVKKLVELQTNTGSPNHNNSERKIIIDIKSIRKDLIKNKINPEQEEFFTEDLTINPRNEINKEVGKFGGTKYQEISPSYNLAERYENSKGRDILSVPIIADYSTTEISKIFKLIF